MNLREHTDEYLHSETQRMAEKERRTTIEVLWHLREIERRMLYAKMSYRDLKEYCVKELKYSEGSAWRRISAMRLLKELPQVESKLEAGDLNLTQISMAQSHFREMKANREEKVNLLTSLENQSARATERIIAECKPEAAVTKIEVIEKAKKGHRLEVIMVLDESFQKDLQELEILLGKPFSKLELFKMLAQEKLAKLRQSRKRIAQPTLTDVALERVANVKELSASNNVGQSKKIIKPTRYISKFVVRDVKARDGDRCQYRDLVTNRQCSAQQHLQLEHIHPLAKGGQTTAKNLQLLCSTHNKLNAVAEFGAQKMQNYMPSIR